MTTRLPSFPTYVFAVFSDFELIDTELSGMERLAQGRPRGPKRITQDPTYLLSNLIGGSNSSDRTPPLRSRVD